MAVGASLSGCGGGSVQPGGGGGSVTPAPLAYEFIPVIRSGQELPVQAAFIELLRSWGEEEWLEQTLL